MNIDWAVLKDIVTLVFGGMAAWAFMRSGWNDKAIAALKVLTETQGQTIAALKAENKDLRECITKLEDERDELRLQLDEVLKEQKKRWKVSGLT